MELVVDANIIFSLLINSSRKRSIILGKNLRLFCPEYLWLEIEEHSQEIMRKASLSKDDYFSMISLLKELCVTVKVEDYIDYYASAKEICPDPDDIIYFAVALRFNLPIWSDDKRLKSQALVKVISTDEFFM